MRCLIILLFALLAGCYRAAEQAENEYLFVRDSGGSRHDRCATAGKAAAAWLQRQDERKYDSWSRTRDIECALAEGRLP